MIRSVRCAVRARVVLCLNALDAAAFGGQSELFIANEPCACDDY